MLGNRIIDDSTVMWSIFETHACTYRLETEIALESLREREIPEKSIITQQFACKRVYVPVLNQKKKKNPTLKVIIHLHPSIWHCPEICRTC